MYNAHIVTLAGIAFYLDDPAHHALTSYLKSVEAHFKSSPDGEEIVADIEHRIAEYFSEQVKQPTEVISKKHVDDIVVSLGKAEEFDDDVSSPTEGATSHKASGETLPDKMLMRDTQTGMLAGVCSGLGAYFNLDPMIFRVVFVVFSFAGGSGFLIYLVLWLVMPEAKTSNDRLRMRGVPINVENIAQQFRDAGERMGKEGRRAADTFSQSLSRSAPSASVFILQIIGGLITTIGGLAMAALTFGATALFVMKDRFLGGTPFEAFPSTLNEHLVVGIGFLVVALPILAVILSGISLSTIRRQVLAPAMVITLWVIWFIAASILFASVIHKHVEVRQEIEAIDLKIKTEHPDWLLEK